MGRIGFSTGALALSDFRAGIRLHQEAGLDAVELSALRESEVEPLIDAIPDLQLEEFSYVSLHAPSRLEKFSEADLVSRLEAVREKGWPIIVHPDIISDTSCWASLGGSILLENMDQRKPLARTADEIRPFFEALPEARFCFDIGHARQVDASMSVAVEMLIEFGNRLAEIHISEVDASCRHVGMSSAAVRAYQRIWSLIPEDIPIIIESMIPPERINDEIKLTEQCFSSIPVRGGPSLTKKAL